MHRASPSMLLYRVSVLVRILPANAIGQSAPLLDALFLGNCFMYLACGRLALRLTPKAPVSR